MTKPGLLTLTIKDKSALYLAYMPFVRNGGLFIPTNSAYNLGDEVFKQIRPREVEDFNVYIQVFQPGLRQQRLCALQASRRAVHGIAPATECQGAGPAETAVAARQHYHGHRCYRSGEKWLRLRCSISTVS